MPANCGRLQRRTRGSEGWLGFLFELGNTLCYEHRWKIPLTPFSRGNLAIPNSSKGNLILLCHLALLDVILWITLVARLSKLVLHQETKIESWATLAKRQSNIRTIKNRVAYAATRFLLSDTCSSTSRLLAADMAVPSLVQEVQLPGLL
jgi:hypothetical protein